jgi:hypothetical protein
MCNLNSEWKLVIDKNSETIPKNHRSDCAFEKICPAGAQQEFACRVVASHQLKRLTPELLHQDGEGSGKDTLETTASSVVIVMAVELEA